jgi:hypothetical protein
MAKAILAYLETALVKDLPNANVSNRRNEPHSETAPAWRDSLATCSGWKLHEARVPPSLVSSDR